MVLDAPALTLTPRGDPDPRLVQLARLLGGGHPRSFGPRLGLQHDQQQSQARQRLEGPLQNIADMHLH